MNVDQLKSKIEVALGTTEMTEQGACVIDVSPRDFFILDRHFFRRRPNELPSFNTYIGDVYCMVHPNTDVQDDDAIINIEP